MYDLQHKNKYYRHICWIFSFVNDTFKETYFPQISIFSSSSPTLCSPGAFNVTSNFGKTKSDAVCYHSLPRSAAKIAFT